VTADETARHNRAETVDYWRRHFRCIHFHHFIFSSLSSRHGRSQDFFLGGDTPKTDSGEELLRWGIEPLPTSYGAWGALYEASTACAFWTHYTSKENASSGHKYRSRFWIRFLFHFPQLILGSWRLFLPVLPWLRLHMRAACGCLSMYCVFWDRNPVSVAAADANNVMHV